MQPALHKDAPPFREERLRLLAELTPQADAVELDDLESLVLIPALRSRAVVGRHGEPGHGSPRGYGFPLGVAHQAPHERYAVDVHGITAHRTTRRSRPALSA